MISSADEIARREHMDKRSVRRLLRLGFLSPRIIEAIAEGHQPPDLTVFSLMRRVTHGQVSGIDGTYQDDLPNNSRIYPVRYIFNFRYDANNNVWLIINATATAI